MKNPLTILLSALFLYPTLIPAQTRAPAKDSMYTIIDSTLAFRVMVPVKEVFKSPLKNTPDGQAISQLYFCTDNKENANYTFGVNRIPSNRGMENDVLYFAELRRALRNNFSALSLDTSFVRGGYIDVELSGFIKPAGKPFYYRILARGNRWYILLASYPVVGGTGKVRAFFNTFTPLDLPASPWQKRMAPDASMSTWTPNPLISSPFDTAVSKVVDLHFTSYDSIRSNTYTIIRSGFNPYYWSPSDSAFLQERINVSLNENDSLIYYKAVTNGDAKGWEWMKHPRNSNMYQRIRVLLNGDQQYILYTTALKDDILSPDANRFFDDFRFTQPVAHTRLFNPKETVLLASLFGADPKAAATALAYIGKAPFRKRDLPLLQEYMLKTPAPQGGLDPVRVKMAISNCINAVSANAGY